MLCEGENVKVKAVDFDATGDPREFMIYLCDHCGENLHPTHNTTFFVLDGKRVSPWSHKSRHYHSSCAFELSKEERALWVKARQAEDEAYQRQLAVSS